MGIKNENITLRKGFTNYYKKKTKLFATQFVLNHIKNKVETLIKKHLPCKFKCSLPKQCL